MSTTITTISPDGSVSATKPITVVAPLSTLTNSYPDTAVLRSYGRWGRILADHINRLFEWNVIREGRSSWSETGTYVVTDGSWVEGRGAYSSPYTAPGAQFYGFSITVNRNGSYSITYDGLYSYSQDTGRFTKIAEPTFENNPFPAKYETIQTVTTTAPVPTIDPIVVQKQVEAAIETNPGVPVLVEQGATVTLPAGTPTITQEQIDANNAQVQAQIVKEAQAGAAVAAVEDGFVAPTIVTVHDDGSVSAQKPIIVAPESDLPKEVVERQLAVIVETNPGVPILNLSSEPIKVPEGAQVITAAEIQASNAQGQAQIDAARMAENERRTAENLAKAEEIALATGGVTAHDRPAGGTTTIDSIIQGVKGKAHDVIEFVRRNLIPVIMALIGTVTLLLAIAFMKSKKILGAVAK